MSHEERPQETHENTDAVEPAPGWTWTVLIVVCLLLVIAGGISSCNEKRARRQAEEAAQMAQARAARAAQQQVVAQVGKVKTQYSFADYVNNNMQGCVPVHVQSDVEYYALGGDVNIHTPDGKVHRLRLDVPHLDMGRQSPGIWLFCKAEEKTAGFLLWQ